MTATSRGPTLHVSVVRSGANAMIRLEGELDVATAGRLDEVLRDITDEGTAPRIIVDAEQLTFIDASGLGPLLAARRRLGDSSLRLRNVRPPVLRVLRLLDLATAFGLDA